MLESQSKKIILITGCSSGFGMLIAARLAERGHFVFATMRNLSKKNDLLSELKRRETELTILPLDVTKPETIRKAVTEIASRHGHIDVLINNAGFGIGGFFEDLSDEDFREQMDVNFFGVLNVTRQVIALMRPRRKGKIINISSVAGLSSSPCFGAYNSSKWALEGFSESLHHELKLFGIDVSLVEPGTYRTKIFHENARYSKNFENESSPYFEMGQHLRALVQNYVAGVDKDPERVAMVVERLVEQSNPPLRNIVDFDTRILVMAKRLLPFRLYGWFIRKTLYQFKKMREAQEAVERKDERN